jgi:hypothetical protein
VTEGIKISCAKKRDLYSLYRNNKDIIQLRNYYKKYCNVIKRVINEAKKQYFHNQIAASSNKVKAAWKIIKNSSGNSQPHDTITKINCEDKLLNNPKDIANAFNKCYTQTVTNSVINHTDMHKASALLRNIKSDSIVQMEIIPVTEAEVKAIVISLKSKNSTGYDGISNKILIHCVHFISKPLTYIFNFSLTTGTFPERCKFAIVRPTYKKGEIKEMNNYRPVSLLTAMSKIVETIMFKRLEQHPESNSILNREQFGFRNGVYIENAIFSLTNNILTSLNQRQQVGGIFCDLTKAFNCVNHTILLNKLYLLNSSLKYLKITLISHTNITQ